MSENKITNSKQSGTTLISNSGDAYGEQWITLMRKFTEENREKECNAIHMDRQRMTTVNQCKKTFPTKSKYTGGWNSFGMTGEGTYTFPDNRVEYEGQFKDGMFHGEGKLKYDTGISVWAKWRNGNARESKIIFDNNTVQYDERDWKYCQTPDRRFSVEYRNGMKPGTASYMTNKQPTPEIPPGYYDTGDGFYDPKSDTVYKYHDITKSVRHPGETAEKWIVNNCRKNPVTMVGPKLDLYEEWPMPSIHPKQPPPPVPCFKTKIDESKATIKEGNHKIRKHCRIMPTRHCNKHKQWMNDDCEEENALPFWDPPL